MLTPPLFKACQHCASPHNYVQGTLLRMVPKTEGRCYKRSIGPHCERPSIPDAYVAMVGRVRTVCPVRRFLAIAQSVRGCLSTVS